MKFRPCIDLHNGKVKQIVGSTLSDDSPQQLKTNFVADQPSSYYAEMYKSDGLTGGHIIMLGPGNEKAARQAIIAYPEGFHIGGGITTANAKYWLDQGAAAVIVTASPGAGFAGSSATPSAKMARSPLMVCRSI